MIRGDKLREGSWREIRKWFNEKIQWKVRVVKQVEATRRKPGEGLRRESRKRFERDQKKVRGEKSENGSRRETRRRFEKRDQKKVRGEKPGNGSSRETRRRFNKTWLMRETKRGFDERK